MARVKLTVGGIPFEVEVEDAQELAEVLRVILMLVKEPTNPPADLPATSSPAPPASTAPSVPVSSEEVPNLTVGEEEEVFADEDEDLSPPSEKPGLFDDRKNSAESLPRVPPETADVKLDYSTAKTHADFLAVALEHLGESKGRNGYSAREIYEHVLATGGRPKVITENDPIQSMRTQLGKDKRFFRRAGERGYRLRKWLEHNEAVNNASSFA